MLSFKRVTVAVVSVHSNRTVTKTIVMAGTQGHPHARPRVKEQESYSTIGKASWPQLWPSEDDKINSPTYSDSAQREPNS